MMWRLKQLIDLFRYDIPRFVRNLFYFRKTLWGARPYDYEGLLLAMRDQLSMMESPIRNGYHLYADRTADRIKLCRLLIDRILEGDYRFDDYDLDFNHGTMKITKTPLSTEAPRDSKLQRKILMSREQNDWDLLFKTLHKHAKTFWD